MILVCEPLCAGFVHANVNAALLAALRQAFTGENILFVGERGHLQAVAGVLLQQGVSGIDIAEISIPQPDTSNFLRARDDLHLCKAIAARAQRSGARVAILSSVNSTLLIGLKMTMSAFASAKVFAIPHAILESILSRPSLRPTRFPFWFGFALRWRHPSRLRYLILGDSIKSKLEDVLPCLVGRLDAIHMPYFFLEPPQKPRMIQAGVALRFGFFGLASKSKGGEQFFSMAEEFSGRAEFVLIGHLPKSDRQAVTASKLGQVQNEMPLSRAEMDELALSIDYALILNDPMTYQLTASAAFYDALRYSKPTIALRSPYVEHHFEQLGDIGYLCSDYEDVRQTVRRILDEPPVVRYSNQLKTLRERRAMFGIERLASLIAASVGR